MAAAASCLAHQGRALTESLLAVRVVIDLAAGLVALVRVRPSALLEHGQRAKAGLALHHQDEWRLLLVVRLEGKWQHVPPQVAEPDLSLEQEEHLVAVTEAAAPAQEHQALQVRLPLAGVLRQQAQHAVWLALFCPQRQSTYPPHCAGG